jgi:gliding motility-associated lipoprotein GldD
MKKRGSSTPLLLSLVLLTGIACQRNYTPKPRGFQRIEFPAKEYTRYNSSCPFSFDHPVYAKPVADTGVNSEPCWINLEFPSFDGKIHMSYKSVENNLNEFIEDSRTLVYKHTIRADAIRETVYTDPGDRVHGILFDIEGNAASNLQFYLTDSMRHFLRGALYFNVEPDKDSLAPVIEYFRQDIIRLMESFEWK